MSAYNIIHIREREHRKPKSSGATNFHFTKHFHRWCAFSSFFLVFFFSSSSSSSSFSSLLLTRERALLHSFESFLSPLGPSPLSHTLHTHNFLRRYRDTIKKIALYLLRSIRLNPNIPPSYPISIRILI